MGRIKETPLTAQPLPPRQFSIATFFDRYASERNDWIARNSYFYSTDQIYMRFLIPEGLSVLEVGCGTGNLLAALKPSRGVGIDISPGMIAVASDSHPELEFHCGNIEDPNFCVAVPGPFDVVVLSDTIGLIEDVQALLGMLRRLLAPRGRLVLAYHQRLWQPLLMLAAMLRLRMPQLPQNWLSTADLRNLLGLTGYEVIRHESRQLLPRKVLGLGHLINRFVAPLPIIRAFCLREYLIARPAPEHSESTPSPSVSVIIPARNERGNIAAALQRMPHFAPDMEIIFVEGHSHDGTFEECERVREAAPEWNVTVLRQPGEGKGDAVRTGFTAARGDILMILDADLTMPPEALPKFYEALVRGTGEFVNGTRLVYPMESGAMRALNFFANRGFALIFSYLLNQRFSDTLCGTKALWRVDYERIAATRPYFGDFDPFGDFDLLFGAARLSLKIIDIPIRYSARRYGETQISRFSDGFLLARMCLFAWMKLKAL